jgi:bacteriocin biosynthesis cyclodehydratase domain-containing protein
MPPDHLVLLAENGHYLLQGDAYVRLSPLLDGRWSDDEVHTLLERDGVDSMSAWLALGHIRALGLVREAGAEASSTLNTEELAFWESLGEEGVNVSDRLSRSRAVVRSIGGTGAEALREALAGARITVVDTPERGDLLIVVADDFQEPRLEAINRAALDDGGPWMIAKLAGTVPWIGPLFVPGKTGCWACLAQRLRLNRQVEQFVEQQLGPIGRASLPASPSSIALAAEFASVEVLRWMITGRHSNLESGLLTLDLKTNQLTHHLLARRPQCSTCGAAPSHDAIREPAKASRVELVASPRTNATEGRSVSPEAIIAQFQRHVSPITGVVKNLFESVQNGYLHVAASQTFPMHRYDFRVLRDNLLGRSGGKGLARSQARASTLCEALERYSGIWQGEEEVTRRGSRRDLGEDAIDVPTLLGFSDRQYAERDSWNEVNDEPHAWVPKPLDEELTIDWVPVRSLTQPHTRFVPAAYCYYGHPDLRHMFCSSDSNGCAAGGTTTEAIAHALLELIERDAAAIWWYNKVRRPEADLDSFSLPIVRQLRETYRRQGRVFWALDLTTDLEIPVIAAISACVEHPVEDIIYGFGSDLDLSAAVTKALLEMNQSLLGVFKTAPAGVTRYRTDRPSARRWYQSATRANQPHLSPDPDRPVKSFSEYFRTPNDDWRDDVLHCTERLRLAGVEAFFLDQTRPDIGLPVSRLIAPGLCHFWRRFGTRRLYEVPVRMGWQEAPTAESDLNPWFIYF